MYKLTKLKNCVTTTSENVNLSIPFDKNNRHFIEFKQKINEDEAELQDADGNVMTAEEAKAYIATLPA